METRGQVIGPNDLLIAAIALTHGLTLVTNNREFSRVPGLRIEDWTVGYRRYLPAMMGITGPGRLCGDG